MKQIEIGEKKYKLMETLFDINDERFNAFKQYLLQVFEKINEPVFAVAYSKYVKFFNAGQHDQALLVWVDFKKSVSLKGVNYDAFSFCFALLCLEENEDQRDFSESTQLRKIKEMREQGLNRGLVEETVENFMKASRKTFGVYLQMLELMSDPELVETLKES